MQWFYFSILNMRKDTKYKFNITNFRKSGSLFLEGMRPLMYSEILAQQKGIGWHRVGEDTAYYQTPCIGRRAMTMRTNNGKGDQSNYTFTFSIRFPYLNSGDKCYLAYHYPFTYSDLMNHIHSIEKNPQRAIHMRRQTLCQTIAGNTVDLITITSFSGTGVGKGKESIYTTEQIKARRGVVITGRVHPGESGASFMIQGLMDFLTGNTMDAKILRDNFVFKIVPMLNPDGVINGNQRINLAGFDLNRQWISPQKRTAPTIYATKQMIKRFVEDRDVILFCDFHAHSRKRNVFIFGCENKGTGIQQSSAPSSINQLSSNSNQQQQQQQPSQFSLLLQERVFPRLLHKNSQIFSYNDCDFKMSKQKEGTARQVIWREFGIINSFTLECSNCGASCGRFIGIHFTPSLEMDMGKKFADTLLDYCDPDQTVVAQCMRELALNLHRNEIEWTMTLLYNIGLQQQKEKTNGINKHKPQSTAEIAQSKKSIHFSSSTLLSYEQMVQELASVTPITSRGIIQQNQITSSSSYSSFTSEYSQYTVPQSSQSSSSSSQSSSVFSQQSSNISLSNQLTQQHQAHLQKSQLNSPRLNTQQQISSTFPLSIPTSSIHQISSFNSQNSLSQQQHPPIQQKKRSNSSSSLLQGSQLSTRQITPSLTSNSKLSGILFIPSIPQQTSQQIFNQQQQQQSIIPYSIHQSSESNFNQFLHQKQFFNNKIREIPKETSKEKEKDKEKEKTQRVQNKAKTKNKLIHPASAHSKLIDKEKPHDHISGHKQSPPVSSAPLIFYPSIGTYLSLPRE